MTPGSDRNIYELNYKNAGNNNKNAGKQQKNLKIR